MGIVKSFNVSHANSLNTTICLTRHDEIVNVMLFDDVLLELVAKSSVSIDLAHKEKRKISREKK